MATNKVIITCAITGSIHTPTMSPHLPITPDEIAEQSIEAAEAGATILHLHARDPIDGRPSADPDVYMQFLPRIKQATNAVINITTGGSAAMTLDERISAGEKCAPEMCSLNMGTMNFATFPMAERYDDWKYEWEPQLLEASRAGMFKNTFADIESILERLGTQNGTRFEFECYDTGHLQSLAYFIAQGLIKAPVFLQFVMGVLGGVDASPESLMNMKSTADRLIGPENYHFSVLAAGRHQIPLATMGAVLGGNVRVGLEDSLSIGAGTLATSNAQQVRKIRTILEEMGHEIASPDEARDMLALKGGDTVNF